MVMVTMAIQRVVTVIMRRIRKNSALRLIEKRRRSNGCYKNRHRRTVNYSATHF
jgi:hypothetical protein